MDVFLKGFGKLFLRLIIPGIPVSEIYDFLRGCLIYQGFNILISLSYQEVQAQKFLKLIFFDDYWHHNYKEEQTCILAYFENWHSFLLTCMNR